MYDLMASLLRVRRNYDTKCRLLQLLASGLWEVATSGRAKQRIVGSVIVKHPGSIDTTLQWRIHRCLLYSVALDVSTVQY